MNVQEVIDELMKIKDKTRPCTDVNGDAINNIDPYGKGLVYVIFDEECL